MTPIWGVMPIFEPQPHVHLSLGCRRITDSPGFDGREPVDIAYILHVFESGVLPVLRTLDTIETFLTFLFSYEYGNVVYHNSQRWLFYQVARGQLHDARLDYAWYHDTWPTTSPAWREIDEEHLRTAHTLGALLWADDRAGLARVLHEVEARIVKRIGLEDVGAFAVSPRNARRSDLLRAQPAAPARRFVNLKTAPRPRRSRRSRCARRPATSAGRAWS
jgi:hypothetical protein